MYNYLGERWITPHSQAHHNMGLTLSASFLLKHTAGEMNRAETQSEIMWELCDQVWEWEVLPFYVKVILWKEYNYNYYGSCTPAISFLPRVAWVSRWIWSKKMTWKGKVNTLVLSAASQIKLTSSHGCFKGKNQGQTNTFSRSLEDGAQSPFLVQNLTGLAEWMLRRYFWRNCALRSTCTLGWVEGEFGFQGWPSFRGMNVLYNDLKNHVLSSEIHWAFASLKWVLHLRPFPERVRSCHGDTWLGFITTGLL